MSLAPLQADPNLTMALYDGVKAVRILQKLLGILNLDLSPGLAIGGTIFL